MKPSKGYTATNSRTMPKTLAWRKHELADVSTLPARLEGSLSLLENLSLGKGKTLIYETIFEDTEFTVTQIGNWQHTRPLRGEGYWDWVPRSQSRGTRCLRHPKPYFYDGPVCTLCVLET